MPNWCEGELMVSGPEEELSLFEEHAKGKAPRFAKETDWGEELEKDMENYLSRVWVLEATRFIPIPQEILDKGFDKAGYQWCLTHWNTKWGFCEPEIVPSVIPKGVLKYKFMTAWQPITPVVQAMAEMFPKLRFEYRYFEGGIGFQGIVIFAEGKEIHSEIRDYNGSRGG